MLLMVTMTALRDEDDTAHNGETKMLIANPCRPPVHGYPGLAASAAAAPETALKSILDIYAAKKSAENSHLDGSSKACLRKHMQKRVRVSPQTDFQAETGTRYPKPSTLNAQILFGSGKEASIAQKRQPLHFMNFLVIAVWKSPKLCYSLTCVCTKVKIHIDM